MKLTHNVYGVARKNPKGAGRLVWMGEKFLMPNGAEHTELWATAMGFKGDLIDVPATNFPAPAYINYDSVFPKSDHATRPMEPLPDEDITLQP